MKLLLFFVLESLERRTDDFLSVGGDFDDPTLLPFSDDDRHVRVRFVQQLLKRLAPVGRFFDVVFAEQVIDRYAEIVGDTLQSGLATLM